MAGVISVADAEGKIGNQIARQLIGKGETALTRGAYAGKACDLTGPGAISNQEGGTGAEKSSPKTQRRERT